MRIQNGQWTWATAWRSECGNLAGFSPGGCENHRGLHAGLRLADLTLGSAFPQFRGSVHTGGLDACEEVRGSVLVEDERSAVRHA